MTLSINDLESPVVPFQTTGPPFELDLSTSVTSFPTSDTTSLPQPGVNEIIPT